MLSIEIKKTLKNYGLNDKEIVVYLAILALGDATVKEIASATKVKRTTIYLVADKLVEKGILGLYKAKYGTHYIATDPELLINRLDDIKTQMANIVPQLKALEKKELHQPNVKFFKGRDGYLNVLNDSLDLYSHTVLYLGSAQELNDIISEKYVTEKYIPARLKRRIKFKQIVFADEFSKQLKETDTQELRQTKFLPNNYFFNGNMIIYSGKVAYFSSRRELNCVVIESKDISEMETIKFELLWDKL
jgi:sugar-specific transcriptional regulator TrmB